MPLESVQILSIVAREYSTSKYSNYIHSITYDPVHPTHPSVLWAKESELNFAWLLIHTRTMFERLKTLGKEHKSSIVFDNIRQCWLEGKIKIPKYYLTNPLLAMGAKNKKHNQDEYIDIKKRYATLTDKGWRAHDWDHAILAYQEYIRRKVFLPNTKEGKQKGYLRLPTWHQDEPIPSWYTKPQCSLDYRSIYV